MPIISNIKLQLNVPADASEGEDSTEGLAAKHPPGDSTLNTGPPDALDILDRLEHSLDNSPVDTKRDVDGPSLYQTATDTGKPSLTQTLSQNAMKRDLIAMYGQGASIQDVTGSHITAGLPPTDINKRRRLDDSPRLLDSENVAAAMPLEMSGLHEPEPQLASEHSSLHVSAPEQPKKTADALTYALDQDTARVQGSDEESDFEIPEIIDSTSGEDE
jgi:hypothetical protein